MSPPNLIILGPQGSGKTTQAELLARRSGFILVSAGDLLREIAREDSESGRKVRQKVAVEGRLVEPELISQIIKERVALIPENHGLILDGYPRTLTQYELFKQFWTETGRSNCQVISFEISAEEAVRRLLKRTSCGNCGSLAVRREDDNPAAIQTRLQTFYDETMPMIRAMEADGEVLKIDGTLTIEEVHERILGSRPQ
jgi:adenylate kinase